MQKVKIIKKENEKLKKNDERNNYQSTIINIFNMAKKKSEDKNKIEGDIKS